MAITTYTAGQVLTAASLNNNFASGGLQLIKTQTIGSAVATVQVTGAFSTTYDNYLITVNGGVASGPINLSLQLGSTTTGYYGFMAFGNYNSTAVTGVNVSNAANWTYAANCSVSNNNAFITLNNPFLTEETYIRSVWLQTSTTGATAPFSGYLNDTTSYTAFTLVVAGTMTGGTIRVYGYVNS